jgi:hypothetical protein
VGDELGPQVFAACEGDELVRWLVALRERLGGLARQSIAEWTKAAAELPSFEGVVVRVASGPRTTKRTEYEALAEWRFPSVDT